MWDGAQAKRKGRARLRDILAATIERWTSSGREGACKIGFGLREARAKPEIASFAPDHSASERERTWRRMVAG